MDIMVAITTTLYLIDKVAFRGDDFRNTPPIDRNKLGTKRHILTDKEECIRLSVA